jgi:ankyrin repeat protein
LEQVLNHKVPTWKMLPGTEQTVTMGYVCFFGLARAAEILYEQNSDSSILENQLELLNTECQDDITFTVFCGTPLHVAASVYQIYVVELLIAKGANINVTSCGGWTVLNSALISGTSNEMIELLLDSNASLNPHNVALTPLQNAAYSKWCEPRMVSYLLNAEANVNAVGNDEAIIMMIRYDTRNERDEDIVRKRILDRGNEFYYNTPLRIVESRIDLISRGYCVLGYEDQKHYLNAVRDLLIEHGAVSLHIPPHQKKRPQMLPEL